jgi:multidrug transporter EmrE-like cation transporter
MGVALSQPPAGYALLLVQATCNNFAAVFTERMLKSTPGSLNWQNLQMYTYGIVISFLALAARGLPLSLWFAHYNGYTWGLVVLGGFTVRRGDVQIS